MIRRSSEAVVKALDRMTTAVQGGYVPPGSINWNDADDNNAFHSKLCVMDFDGTLSTELAMINKQEDYITTSLHMGRRKQRGQAVTRELPWLCRGRSARARKTSTWPRTSPNIGSSRRSATANFLRDVSAVFLLCLFFPRIAKNDPWWLDRGPAPRRPTSEQALLGPTMPTLLRRSTRPIAQVNTEHVFSPSLGSTS